MDVPIKQVPGREARFRINRTQRLIIETVHGLIELRADMDKSHPNNAQIVITTPEDLSVRKGPAELLTLRTKFHAPDPDALTGISPLARMFELKDEGDGRTVLRPLEALRVG